MEVLSWKVPIGRVRRRTSRKRRSMALVVRTALRSARVGVTEAGEEIVEVGAQAGDRLGIEVLPAVGEAAGGGPGGRQGAGVHDPVQLRP